MAPPTKIISLDSDSDDAPPLPRAPPPSQTLPAPVALSSDDERDNHNDTDDDDDDLLEPSFADKVAALVRSRGQSTTGFPFSSRPSSAGTSSTAVVVDLDGEEAPQPAPTPVKRKCVSILDEEDSDSPVASNPLVTARAVQSISPLPRNGNDADTCVILDDDDDTADLTPVSRAALTASRGPRSLCDEGDDSDFTPNSRAPSATASQQLRAISCNENDNADITPCSRPATAASAAQTRSLLLDEDDDADITPDSRRTAVQRSNEPPSPVDIDLTLGGSGRKSGTQSQLNGWRRKKPQRHAKKKPKNADATRTVEGDGAPVPKSPESSDTESAAPADKARRQKKRDRDDVVVVLSRQLGGSPDALDFMGKVLTTAAEEKNVRSEVGDLAQANRVEWRRCLPDRPGYALDAVGYWYGAAEFVELMASRQVVAAARAMRGRHPDGVVFVFVAGVAAHCRRAVRRKAAGNGQVFTKEAVDDCCTALWLDYRLHVHAMDTADEAAEHVRFVAYAVGARPYGEELSRVDLRAAYARKKTERAHAALCPDGAGGVREETPSDLGAVYQKLLALVPGCSPDKAKAIRRIYPSLKLLLDAFERADRPQTLLVDVEDRNGRRLGPKLAHKIWTVLGGGDPEACVS